MSNAVSIAGRCVVCGEADSRALVTTRLARGEVVVVCGTHELIHTKQPTKARTVLELCSRVGDRRDRKDRRAAGGDELADALTSAFGAREPRTRDRRR